MTKTFSPNSEYIEPLEQEQTTKNDLEVQKAIEIIKADSLASYSVSEILSARDLAVEALKQMATTKNDLGVDCIDRAELLKAMDTWDKFGYTARHGLERLDKDDKGFVAYVKYEDMVNCVKNMPSTTPQEPRWIPVSERLPEDYETVIASVGHEYVYPEARYSKEYGWEWAYESGADYWQDLKGVDAWMPLPSAYKRGME